MQFQTETAMRRPKIKMVVKKRILAKFGEGEQPTIIGVYAASDQNPVAQD